MGQPDEPGPTDRRYVVYDLQVSFVCEEGEDEETERDAVTRATDGIIPALKGRQAGVFMQGPSRRVKLSPDDRVPGPV